MHGQAKILLVCFDDIEGDGLLPQRITNCHFDGGAFQKGGELKTNSHPSFVGVDVEEEATQTHLFTGFGSLGRIIEKIYAHGVDYNAGQTINAMNRVCWSGFTRGVKGRVAGVWGDGFAAARCHRLNDYFTWI